MFDLKAHITPDLNWYVVLNGTSDCDPLRWFYQHGGADARGLWLTTPYAEWHEVMPHLGPVSPDHPFLDWIEKEAPDDWGMLVGSDASFETVQAHFRSLTHVWMPSGEHVFFRFYDPRFSLETAQFCEDEQRAALMGPTQCWLSATARVDNPEPVSPADFTEKPFPWWTVPAAVLAAFAAKDNTVLITNSLKWLKEQHADMYFHFPEPVVTAKVTRLVNRYDDQSPVSLNQYLHQALHQEVYR